MKLLSIFLPLVLVCITSGEVNSILAEARVNNALFNYLIQSAESLTNPIVSADCFGKFLPMLSDVAERFSHDYQECLMIANNLTATLSMQASQSRSDIEADVAQMCDAYQSCGCENDPLEFFECYMSTSAQYLNVASNASQKACAAANSYSNSIQIIHDECMKCTNDSEKAYIAHTADTYKRLDDCLQQGLSAENSRNTEQPPNENNDGKAPGCNVPENSMPMNCGNMHTTTEPDSCQETDIETNTMPPHKDSRAFTDYKTKDAALQFMIRSMFPKRTFL